MSITPAELIARKLQQTGELPDLARPNMVCSCNSRHNPGRISKACEVHAFMLAPRPPEMTPELQKAKDHFEAGLDEVTGGKYGEWK